jgi:hypothetical protein
MRDVLLVLGGLYLWNQYKKQQAGAGLAVPQPVPFIPAARGVPQIMVYRERGGLDPGWQTGTTPEMGLRLGSGTGPESDILNPNPEITRIMF